VFIGLVEEQTINAAVDRLRNEDGRPYTRQAIDRARRSIEDWYGQQLLVRVNKKLCPTDHGKAFLESARNVVADYRLMRAGPTEDETPRLACHPHHAYFVVRARTTMRESAEPGSAPPFEVDYLSPRDRAESGFYQRAVERLISAGYDVIIGPPVSDDPRFTSTLLYSARLEAMLLVDDAPAVIPLADLIRGHRLLLPPRDMRSRRLLEQRIREWNIDDPNHDMRVATETYDLATSVMRMRYEHLGDGGLSHVVVATSDTALTFKAGMEFGGLNADRFAWVPIVHRMPDGQERYLTQPVCATTRRSDGARYRPIIDALARAVAEIERGGGARLSGRPVVAQPSQPTRTADVPAPRQSG
jgi:DNA-binding transcriptional LysR family regulator